MQVATNPSDFNCHSCQHKHCDDKNPSKYIKWLIPEVIESKTCLLPIVSEFSENLLSLYPHYKNGFLPYAGGILNQPKAFNEAMKIIENEMRDSNE